MRLIDIDPIIKDKETLSNAFEIVMDSMTGKCLIECTAPTVQALPIDVLDKMKQEIRLRLGLLDCIPDIMAIIDKYRIGSNETQTNEIVYDIGGHMYGVMGGDVIVDILAGKGKK